MATLRCQIATSVDSVLPADRILITPHFSHAKAPNEHAAFVDDVITKWTTYMTPAMQGAEVTVKVYDAEDITPPNYPMAEKTVRLGTAPAAAVNREVAVCLSYFASFNRPKWRGRLYLPACLMGISLSAARPTTTNQTKAADFATVLASMGGTDYSWCLWSRVDRVNRGVTDWWVDNAWDVQRRRGVKPTSRITGTITG